MAAAFVLGAEGVQLGTRFVASVESPVHDNWKQAIVDTAETGTVLLNRFAKPGMRALRTERTTRLEQETGNVWGQFGSPADLYFGGDMEAAIPMAGQGAGRIDGVLPVAEILAGLVEGLRRRSRGHGRPVPARLKAVRHLHHIMTLEDWDRFEASGLSVQSTRDRTLAEEGFIHCSYTEQVEGTLSRFYGDLDDVVVLTLDPERLDADVIDEPAADGTLFPHVYGPLTMGAVIEVVRRKPG